MDVFTPSVRSDRIENAFENRAASKPEHTYSKKET